MNTLLLLAEGTATTATSTTGNSTQALIVQGVILVAFIAIFYFVLIRPQSKQRKAREKMLKEVKVGDRIKTIGGVYGRICEMNEDTVTIEVGRDKVKLVFDRGAIGTVEGGDPESEDKLNS